jgi:Zn-dependent protease/CBS domain-containing protein
MGWSLKLGHVRGIGIYVHATFVLILAWAAYVGWARDQTLHGALDQVVFVVAVFGCIVLHELGHALSALRFGIKTKDITLLPIGGLARLERMPRKPIQELIVALAGPAVNIVIAIVLAVGLAAFGLYRGFTLQALLEGSMIERLMIVNVFLVVFNMLPAFPMDGGRALRALLAARLGHFRATQIAASVGQGMALLFGFVGLFSNPFLVFIALFVWMGASQEAASAQTESLIGGAVVDGAMMRQFRALVPEATLGEAVAAGLAGEQTDFPVLDGGRVVGVLAQTDLIRGLSEAGRDGLVADYMNDDFVTAEAGELLDEAFRKLQTCRCRTIPVLREGQLEGLLTHDNMRTYLGIRNALAAWRPGVRPAVGYRSNSPNIL